MSHMVTMIGVVGFIGVGIMGGLMIRFLWKLMEQWVVRSTTIHEFQNVVIFKNGRYGRILTAGRHWLWWPWMLKSTAFDMREKILTLVGQDLLSSDNVSIKVSLALSYEVVDPRLALESAQAYESSFYLEAQLVLRDMVSSAAVEEFLEKRRTLDAQLLDKIAPVAQRFGLKLKTAGIKDVMFPGTLKQTFAQVVEARQAAQASLEKARGETATLRHLANAARMLDNNPSLVTLKTLQTVSEGNHTLVVGAPNVVPVSMEKKRK